MNNQQRVSILQDMGIPQWVCRQQGSDTELEEGRLESFGISVSGQAASGWMWLLESSQDKQDQNLLADIRRAAGCLDNSLLASIDTESEVDLKKVLSDELITRLVLIGSTEFQQQLTEWLNGLNIAYINCPPLSELQSSASAKRSLWGDLKALMN